MDHVRAAIAKLPIEQRSEWAELQSTWAGMPYSAADPLDTLLSWTQEHRLVVRTAIADYASSQTDARDVLPTVSRWSRRLGVALSCVVAREALKYVHEKELRPRIAIETAERWVRGEATEEECRDTSKHALASASGDAIASAADYAAYAAYYAAAGAGPSAASPSDAYAAAGCAAAARDKDEHSSTQATELLRLCSVIAKALRTGTVGEWIG